MKKTYENKEDGLVEDTMYPQVEEGLFQILRYENVIIYNVKIDSKVVQMSEEKYRNSGY